ncbi:MAG: adenylate/guanylate cyclase domain-containing protein [Bacteroidota bacterium]
MKKAKTTRRLAAIMFTDIVGYTALMQQAEAKAAAIRTRHRQVFEQRHQAHQGEILQYFGDGTLSIFQSGVEAVACAIAIQEDLQKGEKVPLRIGLHIGDIVFDGTEIYGDSVNLASRIESLGMSGAVLLSGRLNEELSNHPDISTLSLGYFDLKNIARPIEVFAVNKAGLKVPKPRELKGQIKQKARTIAVLPFVNRSADPDNEYFSDGMTEEIINALSKIKSLKVTSRTSSFHFKHKNLPIAEIGQALQVATVLEGSVRLAGNKMRITAQLIDVADDFHFWSETFDRSVEDVFAVQDEISLLIADRLRENIGHFNMGDRLVEAPEIPLEHYKNYLRARYHILKMAKPEIEKGMAILESILEKEANFALAHLAMHLAYALLGTIGLMPAKEAFAKGQAYLDKAIAIDENLPECQLNLSYIAFLQSWDFTKGYQHLNRSFEIRPTVEYYQSMASMLVAEKRFDAALNYNATALQLDPFSAINHHLKGFILYAQQKYPSAIACFDQALQFNPNFMASTLYKGEAMILADRAEEALAYFQSLPLEGQEDVMKLGGTTLAYAAIGNREQALAGIDQLEEAQSTELTERALNMLIVGHTMLGNQKQALDLIEQAIELRLPMLIYLFVDPLLLPLASHPRFQNLSMRIFGKESSFTTPKRKYQKSLLDGVSLQKYKAQLAQLMLEEQPNLVR